MHVADVGQRQLVVFLGAVALSLLPLLADAVSGSDGNVVAWLRLAQTFSLVALVPYAVRSTEDGEFVIGAVEFAVAAEMVRAIVQTRCSPVRSGRGSRRQRPEHLGTARCGVDRDGRPRTRASRRWLRVVMFVLGAIGLVMSQSLGESVAVAGTLAIFGLRSVPSTAVRRSALFTPTRVILLVIAAAVFAITLRSENLPVSDNFHRSTHDPPRDPRRGGIRAVPATSDLRRRLAAIAGRGSGP